MNITAMQPNVEAPLPPIVAGEIRPWKRGRLLGAGGIAKFYPAESYSSWTPGGQFRAVVPTRQVSYTVVVERFIPARREPELSWLVTQGERKHRRTKRARNVPEVVVVRILAVEANR